MSGAMILTFDITSNPTDIYLPLVGSDISVEVNWGDGTIDNSLTHTYSTASTPTVTITLLTGTITGFGTSASEWLGSEQITGITQWGEWPALTSLNFLGGGKLTQLPSTVPSSVTDMSFMITNAYSFNGDLSQWNVSNVTNMNSLFEGASSFNGDLSQWQVINVTNMNFMFAGASSFNGDLSQWNVSNVTDMSVMFQGASSFNGDLSQWLVSNVTDMDNMFQGASSFNGDLSQWDVSNVTSMYFMFQGASSFNGDLSEWDVSYVTDMSYMFEGASSFNGDLSSWWVSMVTDMESMFYESGLDMDNYSNTLIGWANLDGFSALQQDVPLGAPANGYINANAVAAAAFLTNDKGWIINPPAVLDPTLTFYTIQTTITFTNPNLSINEWTPTLQAEVINTVATTAGVPESRVNFISATAGSVIVILNITDFTSLSAAQQAVLALNGIDFDDLYLIPFAIINNIIFPISNICFPAGTPIKTDQGIISIDQLNPARHTIKKQAIQHITKTITQDTHLICFEKNALGSNMPSTRTLISKNHKILFDGTYIPASQFLKLSDKIKKVPYNGEILYNVLLKNYGNMQVNNLVCETLHPDNLIAKLFNNYKEAERPDLVCQLNASLLERNVKKYKAVERKISRK